MTRENDILMASEEPILSSSTEPGLEENESSVDRKGESLTDTLAAAVIGVLTCLVIIVLILIIRGVYRRRQSQAARREITQITMITAEITSGTVSAYGGHDTPRPVNGDITWEPVVVLDSDLSRGAS